MYRQQGCKDDLRAELEGGKVDMITFTSSSTVTHFLTMLDAASQEELKLLVARGEDSRHRTGYRQDHNRQRSEC